MEDCPRRRSLFESLAHSLGGLVASDGDRPLDPRGIARRAATAWKGAKVEGIGLHEGRHLFASTMLAAGVGARVVAEIMGHADPGLVWTRYGHVLPGAEVEAVGRSTLSSALEHEPSDVGAMLDRLLGDHAPEPSVEVELLTHFPRVRAGVIVAGSRAAVLVREEKLVTGHRR